MAYLNFKKPLTGFTAFREQLFIPPIEVSGPSGFSAFIYQCYLNVDWDGSHRAYGLDRPDEGANKFPYQKNLTPHESGTRLWSSGRHRQKDYWVGLVAKTKAEAEEILRRHYPGWSTMKREDQEKIYRQFHDTRTSTQHGRSLEDSNGRFPIVQLPGFNGDDKNKGYYVSQANAVTSKEEYRKRPWDQRVYIDAAEVPYSVVPRLAGVRKGDFGLIIRNSTGRTMSFIFGDSANAAGSLKLGECSGCIFTYLADGYFNEEAYSFIVFPRTGTGEADNAAVGNTDKIVWGRMQLLGKPHHQPARELALRLALGKDQGSSVTSPQQLTGKEAFDFQNIGRAFTYYGLDPLGLKAVAKSEDDTDFIAPTPMRLPK